MYKNVIFSNRGNIVELKEVISNRRSTREFSSQKVEKEQIEKLIEYARLAPSAANRQPWHFIILTGKKKEEIADMMQKQIEVDKTAVLDNQILTKQYSPVSSTLASIQIIREVPVLILVFRKPDESWLEGDYLSIGCAVEHICLGAQDMGLGSLWIRDVVYTRDKIAQAVGHSDMELVTAVVIGYSCEYPYPRKRKELNRTMEWFDEK